MTKKAFQDYYPEDLSHCYGCGSHNEKGLQIKSFWDGEESVCVYTPRDYHTAIPGFVYGGLIASLIDCHSTGTASAAKYRAEGREMGSDPPIRFVTASLHVDYLLPTPRRDREGLLLRGAKRLYGGLLRGTLAWRGAVLGVVLMVGAVVLTLAPRLGGEFLPRLSEGAIVINVIRLPGVALEESTAYNTRIEQLLIEEFPDEIEAVWSRVGTAEVATDPMGIELTDVFITLKPRDQWARAKTQAALSAAIPRN